MRHYKRENVYKNSTGTNYYNPTKRIATSFRWWDFVRQFEVNGKPITVFNNYTYSSCTSKHQRDVSRLMRELGHNIDFEVSAPKGLQNGLENALENYLYSINKCIENAKKKGSRRSTNLSRVDWIKYDLEKIEYLIKNNLVNQGESKFDTMAQIFKAESFCANVLVNKGKFIA